MACETMAALRECASIANKKMLRSFIGDDSHLAMLYAQWKLDAERMQRVHEELCQECMEEKEDGNG